MALVQISEPVQNHSLNKNKSSAGIDFGTTNSLVAIVKNGEVRTCLDNENRSVLPSIVHYTHKDVLVGYNAKEKGQSDSNSTITSIKRFIGRTLDDIRLRYSFLPYSFKKGTGGLPVFQTNQGDKSSIQISSDILKVLSYRAKKALGSELDGVVITVPAYFDDAQRMSTKNAAAVAGLNVLRLLNEPTAAAIAYGLESTSKEGIIVVYDLGGGTFDISILRLSSGIFEVLSTGGNSELGGDDFDYLIAEHLLNKINLEGELSAEQSRILLDVATNAKISLSNVTSVEVSIFGWTGIITCEDLNKIIKPLVKQTLLICNRALKDAEVDVQEIMEVIMVGGSTRIPLVREMVANFFSRTPLTSINPDEVVAIGAAIQADLLVGNKLNVNAKNMLLLDVTPLSLGIETAGGLVEKIIPRNTTIPVERSQEFTTFKDAQTAITIHVVQGEREMVSNCRSLAKFTLKVPPMIAGIARIQVIYQVDADGLLSITAVEKSTGKKVAIQVKHSFAFSNDEIHEILRKSLRYNKQDINARALAEQRVKAERIIDSLIKAIQIDGDKMLSDFEKDELFNAINKLTKLSNGISVDKIRNGIKKLDDASTDFATRRINKSIKKLLSGKSINDI
ncbi:chaperone protein [Candidatus Photodesmus katoptron]|uniref:Chaperone protein HscA homolog n=1 Tax=Candidatus Photodesmus katoptron Akat1 TaxID=1236703 RepID=S3EGQ8_9GAMM|nr:Fe-S protein assembly chaperone HscA [Candidatus Photodesmus katoptron]EPE37338.1 fe-S protein assembly chaperone HscA [Candidatus Photodesmus katoptron Akat1]KEY89991.1 chaperone protein [Candidatus Photodesmus katoptron]